MKGYLLGLERKFEMAVERSRIVQNKGDDESFSSDEKLRTSLGVLCREWMHQGFNLGGRCSRRRIPNFVRIIAATDMVVVGRHHP